MSQDPRLFFTGRRSASGHRLLSRVDEGYVCDFCLAPAPAWEYPCGPVPIAGVGPIGASEDEWGACDECHRLIEQASVGALVERIVTEQRRNIPPGTEHGGQVVAYPPLPIARRHARENVAAFMDARTGPARPYVA